jgi:hypothetical protein
MKPLKMWTLLSLLTLLLLVSCTVENVSESEAIIPVNDPVTESETATAEPTLPPETAVPLPTTTEVSRTVRLTPAATPQIEILPTLDVTVVIGEVPEAIMTAVYEDLNSTENISQAAIAVTKGEAIIWGDGSLGCPQPGEVYTQAPVNGYQIVLEANGRTYAYHAAESGYFILCQNSLPLSPPVVGTPNS